MSSIKKFAWSGLTVAAAATFAVVLLLAGQAQVVKAAAPTALNVIIEDDDDKIASSSTSTSTVRVVVDVDDAGGGQTDETLITLTSAVGKWAESGTNTVQVACANDDVATAAAAVDAADENVTLSISNNASSVYNAEAEAGNDDDVADANEEGCHAVEAFLIIAVNQATGTFPITATSLNSVAAVENLEITAAVGTGVPSSIAETPVPTTSKLHRAIGYDTEAGTYEPLVNGTVWSVRVKDSTGAKLVSTQVQFTTDAGKVVAMGANDTEAEVQVVCDSTTSLGTVAIVATDSDGDADIILCGDSAAAGKTATVTATTLGLAQVSTTAKFTVAAKPASADIKLTQSGSTVTAEIMVGGVPAADALDVRWTVVPTDNATVTQSCVELVDGKASVTVAVVPGTNATVVGERAREQRFREVRHHRW